VPKDEAGFTRTTRWRATLPPKLVDVCSRNCQLTSDRGQYPPDAEPQPGGRWLEAGYVDKYAARIGRIRLAADIGGKVLLGVAVTADAVDVATAPPGQRVQTAVRDGVNLAGAWAGGEAGAEAGLEIGAVVGGAPGAIVGGLVGGIVGAAIGGGVVEDAYSTVSSWF
jgi:hypothetical protein